MMALTILYHKQMIMALTLGLVVILMISVASETYAQSVGNERVTSLVGSGGSGQALAHALYNLNQILLNVSGNWVGPTVICIINPNSVTCS